MLLQHILPAKLGGSIVGEREEEENSERGRGGEGVAGKTWGGRMRVAGGREEKRWGQCLGSRVRVAGGNRKRRKASRHSDDNFSPVSHKQFRSKIGLTVF